MINILISTGGSGGHVIPATILYEHLKKDFNIFMSSDNRGFEFLDKDVNESDTITIVHDIITNVFSYERYVEVTAEHKVGPDRCDLATGWIY